MFRIRSFAVFASLFLVAPAFADSQPTTAIEPASEQVVNDESEVAAEAVVNDESEVAAEAVVNDESEVATEAGETERRLSTRERWRGKPYVRAASPPDDPRAFMLPRLNNPSTPSAFNSNAIALRGEALNKQLPLPNLGSNPTF